MARSWWDAGTTFTPASMPTQQAGGAWAIDGHDLWVFGGFDGAYNDSLAVYSYDPWANAWTTHPNLPAAFWPYAGAAIIDGIAYLLDTGTFWAYDLAAGTTDQTLTEPAGGADWAHTPVAIGGLLYWKLASPNPQVYDPATDSWSALTAWGSLPGEVNAAGVTTDGTYAFVAAGELLGRYDPATDSWVDLASVPATLATQTLPYRTLSLLDGGLYLAGGYDSDAGETFDTFARYDITTDAWEELSSLPAVRSSMNAGVLNGRLFLAGGEDADGPTDTNWMWAEYQPTHIPLTVQHTVDSPLAALLSVTHDTSRVGSADAGSTLRVTHDTRTGVTATLHVQHDPVRTDGEVVSAVPAAGPVVTGSISERVGGGVTAQLQREDGTHPTPGDAAFETIEAEAGGSPVKRSVARTVAAAPYGKGWSREGGVPVSTLTTPNPNGPLDDTILPELVKVPVLTGGGITYEVPSITSARLTSLDAPLGARVTGSDDDCAARIPIDDTGRQTRLELAKAAVAEAGFALVTLGTIPNATRKVERDYTTEGQTAASVLSDMLLASNPRVWYTPTTVVVDGRTFTGAAGTTDPTTFIDSDLLADDGAFWQDQAGSTEPEPLLADYTDRCEQRDPTATPDPGDEEGVDVPGTFETFEDGTYSWTERSGQSVGPFGDIANSTYRAATHTLTKSGGQLVREVTIVREQYKRDYDFSLNQIGVVAITTVDNDYHPICPEALIGRSERTTQRKRVEDIPNVSNTLAADEDSAFTPDENHEMIYDALPDWYVEEEKFVEQRWHAEGWLRARSETTRQLEGMIATPQFDAEGALSGYEVTLTYKTDTRNETHLPIGRGLWHIATTVKTTQDRAVKQLINPDAVEGDPDYGVMEVVDVQTVPVQNHYTVVTDQAPPQISCGGTDPEDPNDPCGEGDDPYADCIAEATRRWEIDHADWVARQAHNGPKRVWSIQASRFLPDAHVGQLRGGGLVTSVTHDRGAIGGTTSLEVTEWLA